MPQPHSRAPRRRAAWHHALAVLGASLSLSLAVTAPPARAAEPEVLRHDAHINGSDPGVKLFVRDKRLAATAAGESNVVLFVHGATSPSTCDFDLEYKDYSWADRLARLGYVVYMFDKRNYGYSSRVAAMDQPPAANLPLSRSFEVIRDIDAVIDHIRAREHVARVNLIGWSWGAMTSGYYSSLHSEKVRRLVLYAPAYSFPLHTNLGPGSGLQNKRKPYEFNFALGAYRMVAEAANTARWDGEIPVADKSQYRDPALPAAFWNACLATDPTSGSRTPATLRAPNGVLEDTFMQETGRPLWNASSIYAPTLVIAGEYDTWSYPEDRAGLMRDLTHAREKREVLIKDATHFVLFEKQRFEFFRQIEAFLKEGN